MAHHASSADLVDNWTHCETCGHAVQDLVISGLTHCPKCSEPYCKHPETDSIGPGEKKFCVDCGEDVES